MGNREDEGRHYKRSLEIGRREVDGKRFNLEANDDTGILVTISSDNEFQITICREDTEESLVEDILNGKAIRRQWEPRNCLLKGACLNSKDKSNLLKL